MSAEDNRRGCVIRAPASLNHAGLQHAVLTSKLRCQIPAAVASMNVREPRLTWGCSLAVARSRLPIAAGTFV